MRRPPKHRHHPDIWRRVHVENRAFDGRWRDSPPLRSVTEEEISSLFSFAAFVLGGNWVVSDPGYTPTWSADEATMTRVVTGHIP